MTQLTILIVSFIMFITTSSMVAQEQNEIVKGEITGIVLHKETQEPLPGANITITGTKLGASSDENGLFRIRNISVGTYIIKSSLVGFEPTVATDVVVNGIKPAEITIEMQESRIQFEGVEVSAGYFQKSSETPVSTQQQSAEEIRRLPGGQEDVVRAISILPGVAQVQAGRNDLIVRGGAPSENLFLIDNLDVPNINHFGTQGASGGPLSFVNLDFVEATSFSTGGFGVKYGDKLSSVLNISLREGRKDRLGGKLTLAATQFGANIEGPLSENSTMFFSARRSYLDFVFKAAGFGFVPEYWDYLAKYSSRLDSKNQLSVLGIAAIDRVRLFNETEDQRFKNSRILAADQNQIVTGATWKHLFTSGYSTLTLGQRYNEYNYRQNDSLLNPIFFSSTYEREISLRGEFVFQISSMTDFSIGFQTRNLGFTTDITLPAYRSSFGDSLSIQTSKDGSGWKTGIHSQVATTFGHVNLVAGARVDNFSLIEQAWVFAPRVSLRYAATSKMNINTSVGRYYQAPSALWLVGDKSNSRLNQLQVEQLVIGADYLLLDDFKLSLEGYIKRYSDYPVSLSRSYLVMANTGAGFGGSEEGFSSFGVEPLGSSGSGESHGVELFLQKKLSEIPYYGTVSISYNESYFTALDGIERPGSFDQRWILNFGGGYILNENWEFSAKFRFATGRPYTPFATNGTQQSALYNTERVGINHSLDVRVDRRWSFSSWSLITYLDIQNIYNNKPADVPRYNARLGKVEENDSIGILPSIGISAEF